MIKPANDHDPVLLTSEAIAQGADPLIGELTLVTDRGTFCMVIKKESAEDLIEQLTSFLDTEE